MSLCRVIEWHHQKTVKLSDSYRVILKLAKDDYRDMPECTSVTLPSYKYKEEIYHYGNNSKKFLLPDYTGLEDLTMEFLETYDPAREKLVLRMRDLVDIFLLKLFDPEKFAYKLTDYIPEISVTVMHNNNFNAPVLRYVFMDLKLTDYTKYDLDYSASGFAKWTLKFSYQSYFVEELSYMDFDEPPRPSMQEMLAEKYAAEQAAIANMRRDERTPVNDINMEQAHAADLKQARQEALYDVMQLERELASAKKPAADTKKLTDQSMQANDEEFGQLMDARKKLHDMEARLSAMQTQPDIAVVNAEELLAQAKTDRDNDTWIHRVATNNQSDKEVRGAEGRLAAAKEAAQSHIEQLKREIEAQKNVVSMLENETRETGKVALEAESDSDNAQARVDSLKRKISNKYAEIDELSSQIKTSNEKIDRFTGEYGQMTGREYGSSMAGEDASEASKTAVFKQGVKAQYEAFDELEDLDSMQSVISVEDRQYNEFARPEQQGGNRTPSMPSRGAYDAGRAAAEQHTRESEIANSLRVPAFTEKVKSEDAFGVRQMTETENVLGTPEAAPTEGSLMRMTAIENVLGEPENYELSQLEHFEKTADNFERDIEDSRSASSRLEDAILPDTTKQIFAEARKQEKEQLVASVSKDAWVRQTDAYNERVKELSMEMYDPKKNNAQVVYEKAQEQAMQEYMAGQLKINK